MTLPIYPVFSDSTPTAPSGVYGSAPGAPSAPAAAQAAGSVGSPSAPEVAQAAGSVGSPTAPAAAQAAGSVGSPSAPGAAQAVPVSGAGALVSGATSPDVSGLLIPAGTVSGVAAYSTDGDTTPTSTGRWTILKWSTLDGVVLLTYLDEDQDGGWFSTDAGAGGTLPTMDIRSVLNWADLYSGEFPPPVVTAVGASAPPSVISNSSASNPTAPGAVIS